MNGYLASIGSPRACPWVAAPNHEQAIDTLAFSVHVLNEKLQDRGSACTSLPTIPVDNLSSFLTGDGQSFAFRAQLDVLAISRRLDAKQLFVKTSELYYIAGD
ncbi:MAG: hypothetical protein JO025_24255 [Verrucomicrobia bacterium]|nr:hypothetical protein [Verrucomicrobiota bacterium]